MKLLEKVINTNKRKLWRGFHLQKNEQRDTLDRGIVTEKNETM